MEKNYLTYYQLLGIGHNASSEEILKAYKEKAKEYHPDKNNGHATANTLFQYIQQAKEVLTDPHKRLEYDYLAGIKQRPQPKVNSTGINTGGVVMVGTIGLLVGLILGSGGQSNNKRK